LKNKSSIFFKFFIDSDCRRQAAALVIKSFLEHEKRTIVWLQKLNKICENSNIIYSIGLSKQFNILQ
jgi:hypothetical protein